MVRELTGSLLLRHREWCKKLFFILHCRPPLPARPQVRALLPAAKGREARAAGRSLPAACGCAARSGAGRARTRYRPAALAPHAGTTAVVIFYALPSAAHAQVMALKCPRHLHSKASSSSTAAVVNRPQCIVVQGLKQLAAAKPPTKESTQVKELVAAYEAELAVTVGGAHLQLRQLLPAVTDRCTVNYLAALDRFLVALPQHRSNTLPAGAGWRTSRPLLPPNFAPKPPRHAPPTAAAAAAHTGGATQPLCRPLQLHGTPLQQAAAVGSKPAAPSGNRGLAGPTGVAVCNACAQPVAPAVQPTAWHSMAAKSQQPAQAVPAAPAALPSVAVQANPASPVQRAGSPSGRRAPAPVQHQQAAQPAGERTAGPRRQPGAAAAGAAAPQQPQQPTAAAGQATAVAAADASRNALTGAPNNSAYRCFPGVCRRMYQSEVSCLTSAISTTNPLTALFTPAARYENLVPVVLQL
jgi:hypothetical protein